MEHYTQASSIEVILHLPDERNWQFRSRICWKLAQAPSLYCLANWPTYRTVYFTVLPTDFGLDD